MNINQRIKEVRKALKMNQDEFAEVLLITQTGVSAIEIGRRNPTDRNISLLCQKLHVSEEWLRTGEGEMFAHGECDFIDGLVDKYDLGEYGRKMLETFVTLPKAERDYFSTFVHDFVESYKLDNAADEEADLDREIKSKKTDSQHQNETSA